MRSVTDARNAFSTLIADAEDGRTTHIVKGSTVVAHLVPANAPVLDDPNLRLSFIIALAASEAAAAGADEWREARLWRAGDTVGRLLAWTWRTDSGLCMQAFAAFHDDLQKVVGATMGLSAIWPGIEVSLGVALDSGEIADLFRYLDRNYDEYYHGPYRPVPMSEGQELPPIPADFEQFTDRTARALVRGGYRCLGDVQAASDAELLGLRNFGVRSLAEVRAVGR